MWPVYERTSYAFSFVLGRFCYDESIRYRFKGGIDRHSSVMIALCGLFELSINAGDLSTIEILISKLAFNIQTPLPDSSIAGIVIPKPF